MADVYEIARDVAESCKWAVRGVPHMCNRVECVMSRALLAQKAVVEAAVAREIAWEHYCLAEDADRNAEEWKEASAAWDAADDAFVDAVNTYRAMKEKMTQ